MFLLNIIIIKELKIVALDQSVAAMDVRITRLLRARHNKFYKNYEPLVSVVSEVVGVVVSVLSDVSLYEVDNSELDDVTLLV